jgi:hypothetical protein
MKEKNKYLVKYCGYGDKFNELIGEDRLGKN